MGIENAVIAQQLQTQQGLALSMVKSAADSQKQVADLIAQNAATVSASSRGQTVNIFA